jgi:hypothetical protein
MKNHSTKSDDKIAAHTFQASFDATAGERAAIHPTALMPINIDVSIALTTVMGTLPHLAAIRDAIVEHMPKHDMESFDMLETYAEALAHANVAYLAASRPSELRALIPRATEIRQLLLLDATALVKRGLLDGEPLTELKGVVGYLNIASDIAVLNRIYREHWAEISTRSAVMLTELDEAEQLYQRITVAYAARAQRSEVEMEDRRRAFTLLVDAYDETRRAVMYLRWNRGDLDKIAPSLYAGRGGRRSSTSQTKPRVVEHPNEPMPVAPVDGASRPEHGVVVGATLRAGP